jgi:hypothetical protein
MKDQLQRAMNIARKTGDRLIIFDTARTNEAFVVMSLDEYEKKVFSSPEMDVSDLTENELLDKINGDIVAWKNEKERRDSKEEKITNFRKNYGRLMNYDEEEEDEYDELLENYEDDNYFDEEDVFPPMNEPAPSAFDYEEMSGNKNNKQKRRNPWDIPTDRKKAAEEIIEEDRQYLEDL